MGPSWKFPSGAGELNLHFLFCRRYHYALLFSKTAICNLYFVFLVDVIKFGHLLKATRFEVGNFFKLLCLFPMSWSLKFSFFEKATKI